MSACVLCGSPVWPSLPVVGPLRSPPLCVGPLRVEASPCRDPVFSNICSSSCLSLVLTLSLLFNTLDQAAQLLAWREQRIRAVHEAEAERLAAAEAAAARAAAEARRRQQERLAHTQEAARRRAEMAAEAVNDM